MFRSSHNTLIMVNSSSRIAVTKKLFVVGAILGCLLPAVALADKYGLSDTAKQAELPAGIAGQDTVEGAVGSVIQVLLSFLGIVFFFLVFYAGITWMTARGNEEKITKAKDMIEAAAIGIVLVLAAYAIASFVLRTLSSTTTTQSTETYQSEKCTSNPGGTCVNSNNPDLGNICDIFYRSATDCLDNEVCCKTQ